MPYLSSPVDGARLFYRDWRPLSVSKTATTPDPVATPALVFLHGWPMSSLMFEQLMLPLCEYHNLRCIGIDRRGFGKSDWTGRQTSDEITYDTFATDVAFVIETIGLTSFVLLGASMGCGEGLLAYQGNDFVRKGCKGFVWMGPSLPLPLQTPSNPKAPPQELWDSLLPGLIADRASFQHQILPGIFGTDAGVQVAPGVLPRFERIIDDADALAMLRAVQIIIATDFTEQLTRLGKESETPLLILHGDQDHGMPFEASSRIIKELVPRAHVVVYEKAAHGLCVTHAEKVVDDVVKFVQTL